MMLLLAYLFNVNFSDKLNKPSQSVAGRNQFSLPQRAFLRLDGTGQILRCQFLHTAQPPKYDFRSLDSGGQFLMFQR